MPLFNHLQSLMQSASGSAATIISVSLMLFAGFAMTRITRLAKLPNVTAYIVAGILIGPYCLNAIPEEICLRHGLPVGYRPGLYRLFHGGIFPGVGFEEKRPEGHRHYRAGGLHGLGAGVSFDEMRPGAGWGDLHCVGGAGGGHGPGLHHDDHPADGCARRFREHPGAGGGAGRRGGPAGIQRGHFRGYGAGGRRRVSGVERSFGPL